MNILHKKFTGGPEDEDSSHSAAPAATSTTAPAVHLPPPTPSGAPQAKPFAPEEFYDEPITPHKFKGADNYDGGEYYEENAMMPTLRLDSLIHHDHPGDDYTY